MAGNASFAAQLMVRAWDDDCPGLSDRPYMDILMDAASHL